MLLYIDLPSAAAESLLELVRSGQLAYLAVSDAKVVEASGHSGTETHEAVREGPPQRRRLVDTNRPGLFALLVGKRIRKLRKERNLTQADLARLVGVSRSSIGRVEVGKRAISVNDLFRVLSRFEMMAFPQGCP